MEHLPASVTEVTYSTADEFLAALRPSSSPWRTGGWIFRGCKERSYQLSPSAWRESGRATLHYAFERVIESLRECYDDVTLLDNSMINLGPNQNVRVELAWMCAEIEAIREFLSFCDEVGQPILEPNPESVFPTPKDVVDERHSGTQFPATLWRSVA